MHNIFTLAATFGGLPTHADIAPSSVAIAIFSVLSFVNLTLYRNNNSARHKFYVSRLLLIHALFRLSTFIVRLVSATKNGDLGLELTAASLVSAGVTILYNIDLILAQRVFAAMHPSLTHPRALFTRLMYALYAIVISILIVTIILTSIAPTLSPSGVQSIVRFRKFAGIFYTVIAALPLFIIAVAYSISSDDTYPTRYADWIEQYNGLYRPVNKDQGPETDALAGDVAPVRVIPPLEQGQRGVSVLMIVLASIMLIITTGIRTSSLFMKVHAGDLPWVDNRVTMYVCSFAIEALISMVYTFGRADLKFYIPDRKPANEPSSNTYSSIASGNAPGFLESGVSETEKSSETSSSRQLRAQGLVGQQPERAEKRNFEDQETEQNGNSEAWKKYIVYVPIVGRIYKILR
ncbi:hypothetical protein V1512DRAFT_265503 [Lipomyces arxii]|uniref:uncharacterized protein n=1 Tax=Lipomyces arxii TaxID=56418 RepID=UPI0034CF59B8